MAEKIFKNFWETKSSPLHGKDEKDYFKNLANEINFILKENHYNKDGNVFEIGCGDGSNFDFLNINKEKYEGVDFSQPMIDLFKNNHPNLNVKVGDETDLFNSKQKYSLIFGIGVHQYFSPKMLRKFINKSINNLDENGILVLGFLLAKEQKLNFYSNRFSVNNHNSLPLLRFIFNYFKFTKNSKLFGFWYNVNFFKKIAVNKHLKFKIYNSLIRPYRFTVLIKK